MTLLPPPLQATLSLTYEHLRIARLLVDGIVTAQAKGLDVQEHSVYLQNQVGYLQAHSGMLRDEFATLRAALLKTRKNIAPSSL